MVGGVRVLRVVEAHEFVTGVLAANGDRPVARAADQVFEGLTGIVAAELRRLLIGREVSEMAGARRLLSPFAHSARIRLFQIGIGQANGKAP